MQAAQSILGTAQIIRLNAFPKAPRKTAPLYGGKTIRLVALMENLNLSNGKSICGDSTGWDMCFMPPPEIQCRDPDLCSLLLDSTIILLYTAERNVFIRFNDLRFSDQGL
jgi:hypothetical protein